MADNRESIQIFSPNNDSETREDNHDFQAPGKRRKRDVDRTRVSRACDKCKRYGFILTSDNVQSIGGYLF
jgi:hypothetical protein